MAHTAQSSRTVPVGRADLAVDVARRGPLPDLVRTAARVPLGRSRLNGDRLQARWGGQLLVGRLTDPQLALQPPVEDLVAELEVVGEPLLRRADPDRDGAASTRGVSMPKAPRWPPGEPRPSSCGSAARPASPFGTVTGTGGAGQGCEGRPWEACRWGRSSNRIATASPRRISSPSARRTDSTAGMRFTKVPLLEPASAMNQLPSRW